jgi:NAD(P)-dependent dehydrogenase (short-subunit alcohol dehydrogenase family)
MKEKQVKDPGLTNKTALVTGASRGIGRAIASVLAETGAHVLVHYGRSAQEAQSLVESIHSRKALRSFQGAEAVIDIAGWGETNGRRLAIEARKHRSVKGSRQVPNGKEREKV